MDTMKNSTTCSQMEPPSTAVISPATAPRTNQMDTSPAVSASVTPNMMTAAIHIIVSGMFPLPPLNNRPISSARTAEPVRMPAPIHLLFGDRLVMKESKEANRLFFGGSGATVSGSGTAGLCPSVCAAGASAANSSPMDTP